jgi:TPR repeat protein
MVSKALRFLGAACLLLLTVALAAPAQGGIDAPQALPQDSAATESLRPWLARALDGDPIAQYRVGRAFALEASGREDFVQAALWYRKAAEQGVAAAEQELAILYQKGVGVERDYVEAYLWYSLAADNFTPGLNREQALELRDMMAAFMAPEDLAEARRRLAEMQAGAE